MRGREQLFWTASSQHSKSSLSLSCHGWLGSPELLILNLPTMMKIMFQTTLCCDLLRLTQIIKKTPSRGVGRTNTVTTALLVLALCSR